MIYVAPWKGIFQALEAPALVTRAPLDLSDNKRGKNSGLHCLHSGV